MEFTIPEETLAWLNSVPHRSSRSSRHHSSRGPSRSSTYHESESKYALRVVHQQQHQQHSRRYSLATPPVLPPRIINTETSSTSSVREEQDAAAATTTTTTKATTRGPNIMDLPTEILDTIISYAIAPAASSSSSASPTEPPVISIQRKPTEPPCTATDITSGLVPRKWHVTNYPTSLFLINHTFSAIAFHRVWSDCVVNVALTSAADALCFLKYALSDRQRAAMRRVRFPKIMLSWTDPVGGDVWLREGGKGDGRGEPGFVRDLEEKKKRSVEMTTTRVGEEEDNDRSRMKSLVGLLQTRSTPALGVLAH